MARSQVLLPYPPLLASLALLWACGAPGDDADPVPTFGGTPPFTGAPGSPVSGQTPGSAAPNAAASSGAPGSAAPEAVGNDPGSVPLQPNGSAGAGNAGASPSNGGGAPGAGGAGGSASVPAATPENGVGGSNIPGVAGTGNDVPPGNDTPPAVTPPAASAGSGCAVGAQFFCEDFDAAPLGALQGNLDGLRPERTVSIIDEPGRGRVLQVQAGATYDNKAGVFLDAFSAPSASFFGRAFIRVAQFPSAGGDHWVVVEATSDAGGDQVRPVGGQFSRWAPGADGPSAGDWTDWQQSNAETVAGAWECVEWQIDAANGGNDLLLWVNGTEVRPLDRGNFQIPAIDQLWFGWVVYQNAQPPAYDVRFDEIVLSTERIGCD